MIYLPKKSCFTHPFGPNDQYMLSLSIKDAEIFDQRSPAEKCKALIHYQVGAGMVNAGTRAKIKAISP
jgi:hypothetical protein